MQLLGEKPVIVARVQQTLEYVDTYHLLKGPDVELYSTVLSTIPGAMSSSDRHVILQCFMSVIPKLLLPGGFF